MALTNRIGQLHDVVYTAATFSGKENAFNLTDADVPDTITASNYLRLAGDTMTGSLSFANRSTTTIPNLLTNAFSIATSSSAEVPFLTFDTLNSRIGIGTTSPGAALSVQGSILVSSAATSTFSNGIQLSSGCFRLPDGSCAGGGSVTINTGMSNRLAYYSTAATLDSANFLTVDAANNLFGIGTTTPGSLLSVQANAQITGTTTASALVATSTLFVGAQGQLFNVMQSGNVGIGTTSPVESLATAGRLYVGGAGTSTIENNLQVRGMLKIGTSSVYLDNNTLQSAGSFTIATQGDSSHLTLQTLGRVGISSSTPWGVLSVEHNGANASMPIFVASQQGTSSPFLLVDYMGLVGVGTTSPSQLFSVQGNGLFSGNISAANIIATGTVSLSLASTTALTVLGSGGNTFVADTNTLVVDATNHRVGMGTTTPGSLLSVQAGNAQITGTTTASALVATSTFFVGAQGQLFNVMQSGNVGIGTTSPGSLLSIQGNAQITGTTTASALVATSTLFVGAQGQLLNVMQSGNVGIGTTTPASLLSVQAGNAQVTGTTTSSSLVATSTLFVGAQGQFFNVMQSGFVGIATTSPMGLLSINTNGSSVLALTVGSSTAISSTTAPMFAVTNLGFVGIGTTTPAEQLTLSGGSIAQTPNGPTYKSGGDVTGFTNSGSGGVVDDINSVFVSGRYAYIVKAGNATACSQTEGSAIGCELQVWDVSNSASSTYVGGADSSGSTNSGTGSDAFNSIYVSGRYAYVAKAGNATACSGPGSSAIGCELQIYDISNPSSPTYVGGADASGSTNSGTGSSDFKSIYVSGRYVYITKAGSATACSQTPGSAIGCEFQIYDISNPASPTYVGGGDASGYTNNGVGSIAFNSIYVSGRYAYVGKAGSATACSQAPGSAIGCELQIWDVSNPTSPVYVGGADVSGSTNAGTGSNTFNTIYVSGRYAYAGLHETGATCSKTAGSASGCALQIYDISNPSAPTYRGGADATGFTNSGSGSGDFYSISVSGRYAYVGRSADGSACSQTPGGGCELQMYDVSNPTSPAYIGGADVSGATNASTTSIAIRSVFVSGRYAYTGHESDSTGKCSQTPGSASGCEFQIYDTTGIEATSILAHSLEAGSLQVRDNAFINNQLSVQGGLNVGVGGIFSSGPLSVSASSSPGTSTPMSAFFQANVGIGTTSPWGLLSVSPNGVLGPEFVVGSSTKTDLIVTNAGNVGIGTTSPGSLLSVQGNAQITGTTTASALVATSTLFVGAQGQLFNVMQSGNVGIGSTSPQTTLAINGNVSLLLKGTATTNGVCHTGDNINVGDSTVGRELVPCSNTPADIAEWYPTESDVSAGDIVTPSQSTITYQGQGGDPTQGTIVDLGTQKISILKKAGMADTIMGIVSTAPFETFGSDIRSSASTTRPLALTGRVPVKVNLEGGAIQPGDRIALSSVPGVGTKATNSGMTVGTALEPFNDTHEGKILVLVNLGYAKLDNAITEAASSSAIADVNRVWAIDSNGRVSARFTSGLDLSENELRNVKSIISSNGSWSIDENGKLVVKEIETETLKVKNSAEFGSPEKPTGITTYDLDTKQPYCVAVKSGEWVKIPGECGASAASGSSTIQPTPTPTESPSPSSLSSPMPSPSPSITATPAPSDSPSPTSSPTDTSPTVSPSALRPNVSILPSPSPSPTPLPSSDSLPLLSPSETPFPSPSESSAPDGQ